MELKEAFQLLGRCLIELGRAISELARHAASLLVIHKSDAQRRLSRQQRRDLFKKKYQARKEVKHVRDMRKELRSHQRRFR